MTLPIISADERLKETKGIKGCIFGKSGIGKTSLLWTLPAEKTLFFDLEAGDLAIEGWQGDTIRPRTWQDCRDIAAYIGGPNPALRDEQPYSQAHYDAVCQKYGDRAALDKYDTIFIDSITVAGRLCFNWCKGQPQAFSEKTGKPDTRGAYGLHGQEMIGWLTHLQHTRGKNIWFVGILDEKIDDFNRRFFLPQIEGSKTALELPGIVDQVITMAEMITPEGKSFRAFICHTLNAQGYPAKDRSGRLNEMEEPHLGRLCQKISGTAKPAEQRLTYAVPDAPPGSPAVGDLYIVGTSPSGDFTGHENELAQYLTGGWVFYAPFKWMDAVVESLETRMAYDGSAWVPFGLIMKDSGEYLRVQSWQEDVDLSVGSSTTTNIPDRSSVIAVNTRVITAITGSVTSFGVGVSGDTSRYGNGIGKAQDSTNIGMSYHPVTYYSDTPLLLTPDSGSFSTGVVRLNVQYLKPHGPWNW